MTTEQRLKELIISKYGSVLKFTQKISIPYSTMDSVFRRGINNSTVNTISKVCTELGISIDYLIEGNIMSSNSIKWIKMPDHNNGNQIVHEVKCPVCKCHETYLEKAPEVCYVCEERREV